MSLRTFTSVHTRLTLSILFIASTLLYITILFSYNAESKKQTSQIEAANQQRSSLSNKLEEVEKELEELKNQDQRLINLQLESDINNIEKTYLLAVQTYEKLLDLKNISKNTEKLDTLFADSLTLLAKRNYSSAEAQLATLNTSIKQEKEKITTAFLAPQNLPTENAPPSSGYRRQLVHTDLGDFMLDIITADLNSTRVIVDTATDGDCANDCPVLSLSTYVSRNGAFAGVNGSYFCPATYPSCSDKKNSFDTLIMNKNKKYINSANNIYSTVPAAIFTGNSARFVAQSLEWGRDTGVDAVIANRPLLVFNGQNAFGGSNQAKEGAKGGRSFIGASGNTAYIGVVHNATVGESAKALSTLGIQNAFNLDDGGSTALWYGGYKVGPGRDLPNVVLFVRK